MRILAASDLHGNRALYRRLPAVAREHAVDAMVLAGDLLGSPEGYSSEEEAQRADASAIIDILSSHGGPIFYLMGNDDWIELGIDTSVFQSFHLKCLSLGEFTLVGYQCTLPFMGGIFERREDEIARELRAIASSVDERTILVTHSPAFGVLDRTPLGPAGSRSIATLIDERKPRIHVHGHIHESFGRSGNHFNVAAGRHLRAMVIDVDRLEHEEIMWPD